MRKEILKLLVREFHTWKLPEVVERDVRLPVDAGRIVAVVGPRRAGKTYLLYQTIRELEASGVPREKILYLDFEDERLDFRAPGDLDLVLQAYRELYPELDLSECFFFFDEVQAAPGWERFVRRVHERVSRRVFVTGSSSKLLSVEIATSLRGRTLTFEVFPLSFSEFLRFKGFSFDPSLDFYDPAKKARLKSLFEEYLFFGGFPEVVRLPKELKLRALQDLFNAVVFRDLVERYSVKDQGVLKYFLKRLAGSTGRVFSVHKVYNELRSQGFKVAKDTLYRFLDYAEGAFLVRLLRKHTSSVVKSELSERKVFFVDGGLLRSVRPLSMGVGTLLENLVFWCLASAGVQLSYYKGKKECDFVVNGEVPVHVSASLEDEAAAKRELEGLREAAEALGVKEALVVTLDDEGELSLPTGRGEVRVCLVSAVRFLIDAEDLRRLAVSAEKFVKLS